MRLQVLQVLAALASASSIRVPLHRVQRSPLQTLVGDILATDLTIMNRNDYAYLLSVSVGEQEFSVVLDTGSSDFWVVSSECSSSDCHGISTYKRNQSISLQVTEREFQLYYLMGSATGTVGFETIRMGSLEVLSQIFALVNETQGLGLSSMRNSGILGLSFPSIAAISRSVGSTLLENVLSVFDEPDRFFAFKLGRRGASSSFTLGELDQDIASDLSKFFFSPVSKAGGSDYNYWKLPLRSLTIDNTTFSLMSSLVHGTTTQVAILDTGTTLILGPTRDIDAFWKTLDDKGGTRKNPTTGLWEVRCDRGVSVSFVLGDQDHERAFAVDPSDINWEDGGSEEGWCLGGIQANDGVNSGDWLLGDVFLRNVYVTHHLGNSSHQPAIGLLSVTDVVASLEHFRNQRGPDQTHATGHPIQHITKESIILVYVVSSVSGFIVGVVVALVVRSRDNHLC